MSSNRQEWPTSQGKAVSVLLGMLTQFDQKKIVAMSRPELAGLHFGLGMWIREHFGLNAGNRALIEAVGASDPNEASKLIIEALWCALRESAGEASD